jgi:hypothetical protein
LAARATALFPGLMMFNHRVGRRKRRKSATFARPTDRLTGHRQDSEAKEALETVFGYRVRYAPKAPLVPEARLP